ncbi:MAG: RNA-binding protein [Sedimentisphaerales bacterium]|nr:RNA-binding protein [Sedimentisphaerales bacterium]
MGTKIYAGNLSYDMDNMSLDEMFKPFGTVVSAQVIMDRESGRSKGFGFVEMSSDDEAKAAIDALNGKEVNGRAMTVNEAKPREDRPRSGGGGRSGGGRGGYGGGGGGGGRNRY